MYISPPLSFSLEESQDFGAACAEKLGIAKEALGTWRFVRKSLDIRHKNPKFNAVIAFTPMDSSQIKLKIESAGARLSPVPWQVPTEKSPRLLGGTPRVAIVGTGPSGLFTALTLAQAGIPCDLFERGKKVKDRLKDIAALMRSGLLNPESNVCFGEGGAGTFSDGKLMTRTKSPYIDHVLKQFVRFGADPSIIYDAHPHIGSDKLGKILEAIRAELERLGCVYHFEHKIRRLWLDDGRCRGIVVNGQHLAYDAVFLAIGHSADGLYKELSTQGIAIEPKPFAIGFRIEHPQALINEIQYGQFANHPLLPPAEYSLSANQPNHPGVFSFCMCPGGKIVASHSVANTAVVNGMSGSQRNGSFANSAIVAQVGPEDFEDGPLGGLRWLRRIERRAAVGLPDSYAPSQNLMDFLRHKVTSGPVVTTYAPGTMSRDLNILLPKRIGAAIHASFPKFDVQMRGFVSNEAKLVGLETRTSSPLRILRNDDYSAVGYPELYPIGEGAGYAGGITSCALDGIGAALSYLQLS